MTALVGDGARCNVLLCGGAMVILAVGWLLCLVIFVECVAGAGD
jgi:hypothetical protein